MGLRIKLHVQIVHCSICCYKGFVHVGKKNGSKSTSDTNYLEHSTHGFNSCSNSLEIF